MKSIEEHLESSKVITDKLFDHAVEKIDGTLGAGTSFNNPNLVASYLQTAATNVAVSISLEMSERI